MLEKSGGASVRAVLVMAEALSEVLAKSVKQARGATRRVVAARKDQRIAELTQLLAEAAVARSGSSSGEDADTVVDRLACALPGVELAMEGVARIEHAGSKARRDLALHATRRTSAISGLADGKAKRLARGGAKVQKQKQQLELFDLASQGTSDGEADAFIQLAERVADAETGLRSLEHLAARMDGLEVLVSSMRAAQGVYCSDAHLDYDLIVREVVARIGQMNVDGCCAKIGFDSGADGLSRGAQSVGSKDCASIVAKIDFDPCVDDSLGGNPPWSEDWRCIDSLDSHDEKLSEVQSLASCAMDGAREHECDAVDCEGEVATSIVTGLASIDSGSRRFFAEYLAERWQRMDAALCRSSTCIADTPLTDTVDEAEKVGAGNTLLTDVTDLSTRIMAASTDAVSSGKISRKQRREKRQDADERNHGKATCEGDRVVSGGNAPGGGKGKSTSEPVKGSGGAESLAVDGGANRGKEQTALEEIQQRWAHAKDGLEQLQAKRSEAGDAIDEFGSEQAVEASIAAWTRAGRAVDTAEEAMEVLGEELLAEYKRLGQRLPTAWQTVGQTLRRARDGHGGLGY